MTRVRKNRLNSCFFRYTLYYCQKKCLTFIFCRYNVVRESHPKEVASSRFGNLLLFLPTIMMLGNVLVENLQFAQSFGKQNIDPLLNELLDNIEPIEELSEMASMTWSESTASISSLASSQGSYDYPSNKLVMHYTGWAQ